MRIPAVSGREAVRALEKLGFQTKRQKGSHVVLQKGRTFLTVPLHPVLKKGTLGAIIRQAGIARREFIDALG